MALRVCVLASGSSGNCTYVASDTTSILVDAGLSGREIEGRMAAAGARALDLSAICLTHEHDDHTSSVAVLARRFRLPLYANGGTVEALERRGKFEGVPWSVFTTGSAFTIGDLRLEPFSVPHDSYDPVGFVVRRGPASVGICTDMGLVTELVRTRLRGCGAIIVEANHDPDLLREADRPWSLKQRIAGHQGHLSNEQAAALVAAVAGPALKAVLLAHLSSDCNRGDLATRAVAAALAGCGFGHVPVLLTAPDRPSEVIVLEDRP